MTLQEQLRALIERNHTKLLDQVATLTQLLAEWDRSGKIARAPIVEAQRLTHQMRGAAGSIGFGQIGAAAAELDENLKTLRKGGGEIPADQLGSSLVLLATLQRVASESNPEASALYHADPSQLRR